MALVDLKELVDAGVHFGHRCSRWNPKMKPFIYGKRNLIHIIDLRETVRGLITSYRFLVKIVAQGHSVLFVGTKRQGRVAVKEAARASKMHYVVDRWLGGTLTNFRTIRSRLDRLVELEQMEESGEMLQFAKKESSALRRERQKIHRNLEGIREMDELPGALVVVDPRREKIAVWEAQRLGIPTICLSDTDCDPDLADIIVPGNDDSMRSIQIFCNTVVEAVRAGKGQRLPAAGPAVPRKPKAEEKAAPPAEAKQGTPSEGGPAKAAPKPSARSQARQPVATQKKQRNPRRGGGASRGGGGRARASTPPPEKKKAAPAPEAAEQSEKPEEKSGDSSPA